MQFTIATAVAVMASLATAAPSVSPRQVEWHAVGNIYTGGGCTDASLVYADPVWGAANTCHPLDRNNQIGPIVSYKPLSIDSGCQLKLFYDNACSLPVGGFTGVVNSCVQGNSPFESAIVICP